MTNRSNDLQFLALFLFGIFVIFWVYSLLRVAKDISRRTSHRTTQLLSIACIVFFTPLLGLPIYFLLRPIQRKDVLLAQQEMQDVLRAQTILCQSCGGANMHDHMFCVFCGQKLKQLCSRCKSRFAVGYYYCPYCAEIAPDNTDTQELA